MKKNNVDLICDIGELAALFEKTESLNDFLRTVVSVVAHHMRAAVCSIYLYDDQTEELILKANQGLNPDAIGHVRLKLGEGLTGTAVKQLRPIRVGNTRDNPNDKFFPGIGEENYQSFLAVPILRRLRRIGALVVQDPQREYFDQNDTKALRAIATQLATTIENAMLIMNIHDMETKIAVDQEKKPAVQETFYKAVPASDGGYAIGHATVLGETDSDLLIAEESSSFPRTEDDFNQAVKKTEQQIEELQNQMEEQFDDVASLIFNAHLLILKDQEFSGAMLHKIKEGRSPQGAIVDVVNEYIHLFSSSANSRLKEKVQDVKDLGHRLLQNLMGDVAVTADYEGQIVVAGSLLPSDILKLAAQKAAGLILVEAGLSSHIAILARSMEIPIVLVKNRDILQITEGTLTLIDGDQGTVLIEPTEDVLQQYKALREQNQHAATIPLHTHTKTWTADGLRIRLLANINMTSELSTAKQYKAEGIGLYRSEFPFIMRNDFPSEEEQHRVYCRILEKMQGAEVTFRTLDIGGDKMLSYFTNVNETNPFLGLRAIRFSLKNKDIFHQQLRALLRAGIDTPLNIMFPLIASVDDFIDAKAEVHNCCWALGEEGIPHNNTPNLGVMIELPSAIEVVDELAQEADFLSIGSNDLVQYMLAVDRTNEHISHLYLSHHPAVLRAINRVVHAGDRYNKPVSLCGDMAADVQLVPFLLGVGIRTFSMAPRWIPRIQNCVQNTNSVKAKKDAEILLGMGKVQEVADFLHLQT